MSDYLVLYWPRGVPSDAASAMRAELEAGQNWRFAAEIYQMLVYVRGRAPKVTALPDRVGFVIGDIHDAEAARKGVARDFPLHLLKGVRAADMPSLLARCAFGRYVAVLKEADDPPVIFRDPLGALECLTWVRDAVTIVSSSVPATGLLRPPGLAVDWSGLAAILARGNLWSVTCPLIGVTAVDAGVMRDGPRAASRTVLWRPGDAARRPMAGARPEDLARVVDGCVAAQAAGRSSILVEISGGLDSAIVATSLARCGAKVSGAINHYWPELEGDERIWAQAVADRCGFSLFAGERDRLWLDGPKLMRHAQAPRPGLNAQDPDLDHDLAAQAEALGADALFSGQGGDGVFYQMPHAALAGDIIRGLAPPMGALAALASLARRSRTTIWSLLAKAVQPLSRTSPGIPAPSFLPDGVGRPPVHPWVADARKLPPAKQLQIRGLTNIQDAFGDSLRGRAADLVYPLMAQPVMEFCLATPAPQLAIGDLDRPFARAAFTDRLPPVLLARRSKGDVTVFFAQSLAASLPALRPFLLGGRLVERGLVDAAKLEPMLHAEPMIWRDVVGEVMLAAYLEAWVRVWEARLASGG